MTNSWRHQSLYGWRCGSVVRTSVFRPRTFPDLFPIYGWQVTCPPCIIQLGQLSLPSLRGR